MRKKLIVGNWKMNLNVHEASVLLSKLAASVPISRGVEAVLCPTFLALQPLSLQIDHRQFKLGAQDCYWRDDGAFTGEVAAAQLRGLAQFVIVGHSERRHIFGETDRDIRFKMQAITRCGMRPILCIGESQLERGAGETAHILADQIVSGLINIATDEIADVVIAYEPVWAIGSGETPTGQDIENVVKLIRQEIAHLYGKAAAAEIPVLYGGSVNSANAEWILRLPGLDGLLIGGASLRVPEFAAIIAKAANLVKEDE
jgi:triosephosphate isomerase